VINSVETCVVFRPAEFVNALVTGTVPTSGLAKNNNLLISIAYILEPECKGQDFIPKYLILHVSQQKIISEK